MKVIGQVEMEDESGEVSPFFILSDGVNHYLTKVEIHTIEKCENDQEVIDTVIDDYQDAVL